MILETPVIVLPCEVCRPLVLVAHLGRVAVSSVTPRAHTYRVELKNTSLYTLDTDRSPELDCERHGKAILHNTHIELHLQRGSSPEEDRGADDEELPAGRMELDSPDAAGEDETWQLDGYIVGPLKVALSKNQFRQLLETVSEMGATPAESLVEEGLTEQYSENVSETELEANIMENERKVAVGATLEAAHVRAHFAIAEFLVEFCEEDCRPFARMTFHEFDFEMIRHTKQSQMNVSVR